MISAHNVLCDILSFMLNISFNQPSAFSILLSWPIYIKFI